MSLVLVSGTRPVPIDSPNLICEYSIPLYPMISLNTIHNNTIAFFLTPIDCTALCTPTLLLAETR